MLELAKVTTKGQVVIPSEIRKKLGIVEGTQLVVSNAGGLVVMKKLAITDPKKEFEKLTRFGTEFAKKKGIKDEEDVALRIIQGRGIKSAKGSS